MFCDRGTFCSSAAADQILIQPQRVRACGSDDCALEFLPRCSRWDGDNGSLSHRACTFAVVFGCHRGECAGPWCVLPPAAAVRLPTLSAGLRTGFGNLVDWVPYSTLAEAVKSTGKPGMVVIHKSCYVMARGWL